jgi:uncharacterized repeat protein (TIGR01451 family)
MQSSTVRRFIFTAFIFAGVLCASAFFSQRVSLKSVKPGNPEIIAANSPTDTKIDKEKDYPEGLSATVTAAPIKGTPQIKLREGQNISASYSGEASSALQSGQAAPLTLAVGDFNSDGYEDVIGGYAGAASGIVTLYRTNGDSIAPGSEKIHTEMMHGHFPAPFLPEAVSFVIPEAPDFIGTGDFNRDGFKDVLTAARGGFALHLLAGDGRGNFRYERKIELPGAVTTMLADDVNNYDSMTDAIIGIGGDAPKALIFHNSEAMFDRNPVEIHLPADAAALSVGQMDADALKDLVIATGNEILIVRGYNQTMDKNPKMKFERVALLSNARSVATGEFVFDREIRTEIAVLLDNGTVNFIARGNIDRRRYSAEEQKAILEKRRMRDYSGLEAFRKSSVKRSNSTAWTIVETLSKSQAGVGESAKLMTAQLAGLSTDDLIIVDSANSEMRLVQSSQSETNSSTLVVDLDVENAAVAAVPLRLNLDTAPDIVVLHKGQIAPTVMLSPSATINVSSSAADVIANNGQCSLREAIINANNDNQSGSTDCTKGSGADTIMMPQMTYTLALGSFDEEPQNGYRPETGDLDIADGDGGAAGAVGDLTIVGATGIAGDLSVIQAGTTATNGIDRVFDVNNASSPGTAVNVTFTNLTIRHGKGFISSSGYFSPGGGIQFDGSNVMTNGASNKTLALNSSTVTLNRAAGQGGGISAVFCAVNLNFTDITSNTITDTGGVSNWSNAPGGGLSYDGGGATTPARTVQTSSTLLISNVIDPPDAGQANFGQGGGARLTGGTGADISDSIIEFNDAVSFGGGLSIDAMPAAVIAFSAILHNDANTGGGGLFSKPINSDGSPSMLTMIGNNDIYDNRADADNNNSGDGGGIFHERGNLTIGAGIRIGLCITVNGVNCGNTAVNGGGIANTSGTLTMTDGLLAGNRALDNGGGIYALGGTLNLSRLQIRLNSATGANGGGALFRDGPSSVTINLSRFFGNTAPVGTAIANRHASSINVENNWWGCDDFPNATGCQTATSTFDADPRIDLRLDVSPPQIMRNGTSTLTARFNQNSDGAFINPTVMNKLTATFAAQNGTVSPTSAIITNLMATSTYTNNGTCGLPTVSATVDNGTQNASIAVVCPPTITKSFSPTTVTVGEISTLTIIITNPSTNTVALTDVSVTDTFPAGTEVDTASAATNSCLTGTFAPTAGATNISISGATIPVNTSCTFTVKVKGTTVGAKLNTTGNVTSANGGTGATASATLTVNNSYEADVSARPNGDGSILSDDVVQIRKFLNGTDTADQTTNEFQRADSAPFATKGDGRIFSDDVVQARRYQNGTNPKQTADGPLTQSAGRTIIDQLFVGLSRSVVENAFHGVNREVRVESATASAGQTVTVNIRVVSSGDESEYGFILDYDSNVLSNPVIGAGNTGASVRSCNTSVAGQINCSIGGFVANNANSVDSGIGEIAMGANQILISVTFTIATNAQAGNTPLALSNVNASNDAPQLLTPAATGGAITRLAVRQRYRVRKAGDL